MESIEPQVDNERNRMLIGERQKFLDAVRRLYPRVLASLGETCQSIHAAIIDHELGPWREGDHRARITHVTRADLIAPSEPLRRDLAAAVDRWLEAFHLRDDWLIDVALETLGWSSSAGTFDVFFYVYSAPTIDFDPSVVVHIDAVSITFADRWHW